MVSYIGVASRLHKKHLWLRHSLICI